MTITSNMSSPNGNEHSPQLPPRKPPTKTSEHRRATKPIMEKRRRARINQCLNEIKKLILDALHKDPSRHSKLEKADILEMTVRHLQNVQRQQMAAAISTDPTVINKYRAGFSECANEVTRYVSRIDGVDQGLRQRLNAHLNACVTSVTVAANSNPYARIAFPGMIPSNAAPLQVQIPFPGVPFMSCNPSSSSTSIGDINNNHHSSMASLTAASLGSIDSKNNLSTPPASASSTSSSHFNFPIPLINNNNTMSSPHAKVQHSKHSISIPSTSSMSSMSFNPISFWNRSSAMESPPIGHGSNSPGGSSIGSGQISPSGSDVDMVIDPVPMPIRGPQHDNGEEQNDGDCVWRPW